MQIVVGVAGTSGVVGGAAAGQGGTTTINDPDSNATGGYSQTLLSLWGTSGTVAQPGTSTNGGNGGGCGNPNYASGGAGGGNAVAGAAGSAPNVSKSGTYFLGESGAGGGGASAAGGQSYALIDWQPQPNPGSASSTLGGGGAGGQSLWAGIWTGRQGATPGNGATGAPIPFGNDVPGCGGGGGGCNGNGNPGGAGFVRIYL